MLDVLLKALLELKAKDTRDMRAYREVLDVLLEARLELKAKDTTDMGAYRAHARVQQREIEEMDTYQGERSGRSIDISMRREEEEEQRERERAKRCDDRDGQRQDAKKGGGTERRGRTKEREVIYEARERESR